MEFWGVEVKPGQTLTVNPGEGKYLHLSQASLGEIKKDKTAENVPTFVKFDDQKLVLGTLSADKYPQVLYDLVFEKEFELSHSSKTTSVFFCGYKTMAHEDEFDQFSDECDSDCDSEPEEDVPAAIPLSKKENGKPAAKAGLPKSAAKAGLPKSAAVAEPPKSAAVAEPPKSAVVADPAAAKAGPPKQTAAAAKPNPTLQNAPKVEEDGDSDEDDEGPEEDSSDEEMAEGEDDSDEEDEDNSDEEDSDEVDSSDEDEATPTPVKAQAGKKRPLGSSSVTPVADKKAKVVSPAGQKAGGSNKKQGHTATPHPVKQAGKTPVSDKSKQQTPKSAGSVNAKPRNKNFNKAK